ncbi:MAG TPA: hypothetical protein VEV63_00680 [Streptosporangiaceae bacterium]|nr:hypothetical protein [Streptosporangiaceae bacterium]
MTGHRHQRTRRTAIAYPARWHRPAHTGQGERWPIDGNTDAEASEQLAAVARFYLNATPETATISATSGLAVVARSAIDHVRDTYLTPWSAGDLRHKLMAVSLLFAMTEDQLLASAALDIAVGWARHGGQERAVTAAIAFGGPLGRRHLAEAKRWLWVLTMRDERVCQVASLAFGQLFAVEAATDTDRSEVARFLAAELRLLMQPEAAAHERRAALTVVNAVLSAARPDSPTPAVAGLVRARQADLRPVAELWAATLNSVPHRRMAVIALHLTLAALTDDTASLELAASLGHAILPRLTERTREVLALTLPDPQRTEAISARLIAAFFDGDHHVVGARSHYDPSPP